MRPALLITRHVFREAAELLTRHCQVDYHDSEQGLSPEELQTRVAAAKGMVCQLTDCISAAVIAAAPELSVIANVAVGYDNIDLAAATERGILVTNTPGVLTETTADFTWALVMASARRVVEADRFLREGHWKQWQIDLLCGHDVHGRTLGIVGFGRIGQAVAARARGFGMRVLYCSRRSVTPDIERRLAAEHVPLDALLRESDIVSLHVPLTPETRHLIGEPELAAMKEHAILVNTSRGPVVDGAALARALAERRIAGAGLDVFEREPIVDRALTGLDNVVLAPHIASASVATRRRMCVMAAENAVTALSGKRPPNLVNPGAS